MKKNVLKALTCAAIAAVLLSACGLAPLSDSGTLVMKLSSQPLLTVKTIVPNLDMEPAYYDVFGEGPGTATFEQLGLTDETVIQASLIPGEWIIIVKAYNGDEPATQIGYGTATVTILAGAVSDVTIVVEPLSGVGQLSVRVTWPEGVLIDPMVEGTLTPASGPGVSFTNATDDLSASYLSPALTDIAALPTGYYTLALWLSTGRADGTGRDTVWGAVEAVRIVAGQLSATLFELVEDVNRGGIVIQNEFDNPFDVTITGVDPEVLVGLTIYAAANPIGADTYEWYLDGMPLVDGSGVSINANEINILGGIGLGHHWLSVVVTSGSVMSSTSVEFDVVREYSGSDQWGVMVWDYDVWG